MEAPGRTLLTLTECTLMPPTGRLAVCPGVPECRERSPVHRGVALGGVRVLMLGKWRAGALRQAARCARSAAHGVGVGRAPAAREAPVGDRIASGR